MVQLSWILLPAAVCACGCRPAASRGRLARALSVVTGATTPSPVAAPESVPEIYAHRVICTTGQVEKFFGIRVVHLKGVARTGAESSSRSPKARRRRPSAVDGSRPVRSRMRRRRYATVLGLTARWSAAFVKLKLHAT